MFRYYEPTELELWTEDLYKSNAILNPSDITVDNLSRTLGIPVSVAPGIDEEVMRDPFDQDFFVIYLNSLKSVVQQKLSFLHELYHGLRHVGNQLRMPEGLRKLQEEQANHFVLYAALPFFMIKQIELPQCEHDVVRILVTEFGVTRKLASRRLDQIKCRSFYGQAREEFVNKLRSQYTKAEPQPYSAATLRLLDQLKKQTTKKGV
ncbi:ImmA/IrrE family metallo-endopeptidase [Brevibacillus fluminis]|uniref:ImmA/IrrE family metallo-endopeptidase n=1 Tax=Brevibacillus fluminis TaxID=511487 RepID=UPI003F8C448A